MYKRILVPLDGSPRAERILPHVEELALACSSTVILLRVVDPVHVMLSSGSSRADASYAELEKRTKKAKAYLEEQKEALEDKGIKTEIRVEHGTTVDSIIQIGAEEDVKLIAIASHGYGGLARVFYGSVAAGLLQRVDRPIMIVRARRD